DADQARLLRLMNGGTYGTWQTVMERRLEAIRADSPNDDTDVKFRLRPTACAQDDKRSSLDGPALRTAKPTTRRPPAFLSCFRGADVNVYEAHKKAMRADEVG
ncbi:hypothetical protein, partial [Eggerthella lenta]|uniref:hypothetical protein n=1 Tax=Eggerthella lenta TaxID=84112 RepID=UPI0021091FA8